jgi:hypothetical protein
MRFGFIALAQRLERRLAQALALRQRALPADLARLEGVFREKPATLEARAYSGPALGYARFVELSSDELEIGNLLLFPRPELGLPVLGVDLVGLGRETAVVVADLSPVRPDQSERQLAVLGSHRRLQPLPGHEDPPAWADEWMSSGALCARIGLEHAADAAAVVGEFVDAFLELVRLETRDTPHADGHCSLGPASAREVAERHARYCAAHRERDRGLLLLRRIFQPERADRFLREVLFPERLPA